MKYLVPLAATIISLCCQAGVPGRHLPVSPPDPPSLSLDILQGSRDVVFRSSPEGADLLFRESSISRGEKVYLSSCRICHDSGALGAPRLGDLRDWPSRIAKGRKALVDNAVKGYGQMPAKGGRASLTAREVAMAIDYMLLKLPSPGRK